MEIRTKILGHGVGYVSAQGVIDNGTAPTFREALRAMVDTEPTGIILSVGDVTYMDSAGLAVLIELVRWSRDEHITLVLSAPSEPFCRAVELGQLQEVFEFVDRDAAAFDRFELPRDVLAAGAPPPDSTP